MSESRPGIEELREAFRAAARDARPSGACPDPGRLWAACHGTLSAADARAIVDHTSACAACAEAWRLALEMESAPASAGRALPGRPWKVWAGLAASAALVALALVGLQQLRRPMAPAAPAFRDSEAPRVRALVPEDRPLPRERCLLRWSSPVAEARFDIHVATESLVVIAEARGLTQPEFLVPAEALAGLPARAKLLWQVESVLPDGERIESRTFIAMLE